MKNKVYKLLLPVLLVTSVCAMNAGELPVKPIAPESTSMDIIVLYQLADTFAKNGFELLAISTRDTANKLANSLIYGVTRLLVLQKLLVTIKFYLKDEHDFLFDYALFILRWVTWVKGIEAINEEVIPYAFENMF